MTAENGLRRATARLMCFWVSGAKFNSVQYGSLLSWKNQVVRSQTGMFWLRHLMQTAFVVFERLTALDFVGIYDPLSRLSSIPSQPGA